MAPRFRAQEPPRSRVRRPGLHRRRYRFRRPGAGSGTRPILSLHVPPPRSRVRRPGLHRCRYRFRRPEAGSGDPAYIARYGSAVQKPGQETRPTSPSLHVPPPRSRVRRPGLHRRYRFRRPGAGSGDPAYIAVATGSAVQERSGDPAYIAVATRSAAQAGSGDPAYIAVATGSAAQKPGQETRPTSPSLQVPPPRSRVRRPGLHRRRYRFRRPEAGSGDPAYIAVATGSAVQEPGQETRPTAVATRSAVQKPGQETRPTSPSLQVPRSEAGSGTRPASPSLQVPPPRSRVRRPGLHRCRYRFRRPEAGSGDPAYIAVVTGSAAQKPGQETRPTSLSLQVPPPGAGSGDPATSPSLQVPPPRSRVRRPGLHRRRYRFRRAEAGSGDPAYIAVATRSAAQSGRDAPLSERHGPGYCGVTVDSDRVRF